MKKYFGDKLIAMFSHNSILPFMFLSKTNLFLHTRGKNLMT